MGRGEFLELDDQKTPAAEEAEAPVIRDQAFFLNRARQSLYAGEPAEALKYFSRALEQNINLEEAWAGQLLALLDLGDSNEVQVWAQRALEHCPGSAPCNVLRAAACIRQGFTDKGAAFLDAALKARRNSWLTWLGRAELLVAQGSAKNADLCVQKALECGGEERFFILRRAGEMLIVHNQPGLALPWLREATALAPRQAVNHLREAQALSLLGRADDARRQVDDALRLDPHNAEAARLSKQIGSDGRLKQIWRRLKGAMGS